MIPIDDIGIDEAPIVCAKWPGLKESREKKPTSLGTDRMNKSW